MVVALSVGIVLSWKWGPERCQLNWLDVIHPYQLWKQLSVSDGNEVHRGLSFSNFYPLGLPLKAPSRSVGRDVVLKVGGAVGLGCRRLGQSVLCGK